MPCTVQCTSLFGHLGSVRPRCHGGGVQPKHTTDMMKLSYFTCMPRTPGPCNFFCTISSIPCNALSWPPRVPSPACLWNTYPPTHIHTRFFPCTSAATLSHFALPLHSLLAQHMLQPIAAMTTPVTHTYTHNKVENRLYPRPSAHRCMHPHAPLRIDASPLIPLPVCPQLPRHAMLQLELLVMQRLQARAVEGREALRADAPVGAAWACAAGTQSDG